MIYTAMITFKQFAQRKQIVEQDLAPPDEIMKAATQIGKKNKKAIIGATDPKDLPDVMKDKSAVDLVNMNPTYAGKLGQILTGLDAEEVKTQSK